MNRQTVIRAYMLTIIAASLGAVFYSLRHFPLERIDARLLALTVLTIAVSSRLTIRIPRISGHISVSDTFFFLTILIYGGEAAVLLAAIIYFTYRTYLRNIEVMAAAATAEAAAAHAAEAERHVAELNHFIAEQKRIREQFTQIEKMSALGELASGVAHDFNNTLAGI